MAPSKVIMVVATRCTEPGKEAEFCRWYDEVHIPQVLEIPGILSATRYDVIDPDDTGPHCICIYELKNEAAIKEMASQSERRKRKEIPDFSWGPKFEVKMRGYFRKRTAKKSAK